MEYLDFLMRSIHSHTAKTPDSSKIAESSQEDVINEFGFRRASFSPPIILVGTNKQKLNALNRNEIIEKKFGYIKEFVSKKTYEQHIVQPYFAIDTSDDVENMNQATRNEILENQHTNNSYHDIDVLRRTIKLVALNEPYMGEQQPLKWMNFEKSLEKLKSKGLFYASLSQVKYLYL